VDDVPSDERTSSRIRIRISVGRSTRSKDMMEDSTPVKIRLVLQRTSITLHGEEVKLEMVVQIR
jgi:hypothetical protein